ncbi:S8 family serine peptidase [Micromonospora sp. BQ11]|uniref:S8 family serine peptidase n=1 Tax=Micromonospora sp. BQ11 TaxID=3452212 RepID=UPI003F8B403E
MDAFEPIHAGRVDARLFDIATLRRYGYDDRSTTTLPLLLESATGRDVAARSDATVTRDLSYLRLTALRADGAARASLWRNAVPAGRSDRRLSGGVDRIWLDGKRRLSDDVSNAQIGVPAAWKQGLTGSQVPVAVLDSGIDSSHPDLAGQIAETANFTDDPDIDDHVGHGTHVASIIAGTGAASAGKYRGVAPGVRLNIAKVCGSAFCMDSAIIAGMQWAAPRSRVINMSLGGQDTPELDPLEMAVRDLTARYDTLFVVAAGNEGGGSNPVGTVGSPGSADEALTVAAVDSADRIAPFSSRGPRVGDAALKPDIAAPGVDIVAARAAHSDTGDGTTGSYTSKSGTSMASPHVAAAAAILTGQHPEWTAARRKEALMASTTWLAGATTMEQGAGRVDVARAITQDVTVDGGSLSFGRQAWPHTDDEPIVKTVTYRNAGTKPITLSLALEPARPGFTLGAETLTVPAGGAAATTLRVDTRVPSADGLQDGYLLATGAGDVQVRTPYAVDKEVESYTVKLTFRDRDGSPADFAAAFLTNKDNNSLFHVIGAKASVTFRVPRGTYGLSGFVFGGRDTETPGDDESTVLGQPDLLVDRTMTLKIDARRAEPVAVTVPPRDAKQLGGSIYLRWPAWEDGMYVPSFRTAAIGRIGPAKAVPGFITAFSGSFARAGRNSPYLYELYLMERGRVPNGYRRAVKDADLATIDATYVSDAPGAVGGRVWQGTVGDSPNWTTDSYQAEFDFPFRRTEHVSVDNDLGWATHVFASSESGYASMDGPRRTYPAGRVTRENWHLTAP